MSKTMAIIENGIVVNIAVFNDNELETINKITYTEKNPAYIGGDYVDGYFYPEQPYPSWSRDKGNWIPPILYPNDGNLYIWNEETTSWKLTPSND
jgi:hypothetical protein